MLEMKDDKGNDMFYVVRLQTICSKCKARDKEDCPHYQHKLPVWKTGDRQNLVRRLYQDNTTLMAREAGGMVTGDIGGVFSDKEIERFSETDYFDPTVFERRAPTMIITTCDPNGGGDSHTAICSLTFYDGKYVVSFYLVCTMSGAIPWLY